MILNMPTGHKIYSWYKKMFITISFQKTIWNILIIILFQIFIKHIS